MHQKQAPACINITMDANGLGKLDACIADQGNGRAHPLNRGACNCACGGPHLVFAFPACCERRPRWLAARAASAALSDAAAAAAARAPRAALLSKLRS